MASLRDQPFTKSDEVGRLVETLFKNVGQLLPYVRLLTDHAKAYHKAMADCTRVAGNFWEVFTQIGEHAASYRTSTRYIGDAMLEVAEVHRQIELQRGDVLKSFLNDFVLPLESKVEGEDKALAVLEKNYRDDSELRLQMVEQAEEQVKEARKRFRKDNPGVPYEDERDRQMQERLRDCEADLYDVRSYGLKKALLLERKIHCSVVDRFCAVIRSDIIYHGKSHNGLSRKVNEWGSLVSDPSDILPEAEELLKDPNPPARNKWLEDDSRHLLEDAMPAPRFRKVSNSTSADTTLNRPQTHERRITPPADMRFGLYRPGTSSSQLNLDVARPIPQARSYPQLSQSDESSHWHPMAQASSQHQHPQPSSTHASVTGPPSNWAVDEPDTASYPQTSVGQPLHLQSGIPGRQEPPASQHGVTQPQLPPHQQPPSFNQPQGMQRPPNSQPVQQQFPHSMGQQNPPSLSQPQGVQQPSFPQQVQQQYPLTGSSADHQQGSSVPQPGALQQQQQQLQHHQQPFFNQPQGMEQMSQPVQQQFQPTVQPSLPHASQPVPQPMPQPQPQQLPFSQGQGIPNPSISQPTLQQAAMMPGSLGIQQQSFQLTAQSVPPLRPMQQQSLQPLQQQQLSQPVPQPIQQVLQQPVGFQPQTIVQQHQQPVQVRGHPQTVFIQQPVGQRFQPQTIAASQLAKPKYGMRVRACYTYKGSSASQLAFRSGDLIDAVGTPKDGWQYGENCRTGKSGWFPSNYIEHLVAVRDQRATTTVPHYLRRNQTSDSNIRPTIPVPDYGMDDSGPGRVTNLRLTPPLTSSPTRPENSSPPSQSSLSSQAVGAATATVTAVTAPLVVPAPVMTPAVQQPGPMTSITQFRRLEQFE